MRVVAVAATNVLAVTTTGEPANSLTVSIGGRPSNRIASSIYPIIEMFA